jgi:hypothetical protein
VDYSLSQVWALFYKCNEPDVYALDTLDGVDLKSTLRIGADSYICTMGLCDKLLGIMSTVLFTDEQYTPIWSLPYFGIYSVKTFYEVVNYLLFLIISMFSCGCCFIISCLLDKTWLFVNLLLTTQVCSVPS